MVTTVIRGGSTVRIQIRPRSIVDTYIEGGFLFVLYSDGEIDNVGFVGGVGFIPNGDNVYANSDAFYANAGFQLGGINA